MTGSDSFGAPVAGDASSVAAWNAAWQDALHFVGDPFARLAEANDLDESFALGSVFCGAYRILGGAPLASEPVLADLVRAQQRSATRREQAHLEALELLVSGNFTAAAERWDQAASGARDLAAVRLAHDVYLHIGDAERRLESSKRAADLFTGAPAGEMFVLGQYSFALEECGAYAEAERLGLLALEADPLDLWALHALAHVYESTEDSDKSLALLRSREPTWSAQASLAVHIHWHHALRMLAVGEVAAAIALYDNLLPVATTAFRLCDLASLLWRLELLGIDVGDRWLPLADRFADRPERHTSGFLDLHMAMAFTRCSSHRRADQFFDGVVTSYPGHTSENAATFRDVVVPLVEAIRISGSDAVGSAELLDSVAATQHRIGGSNAQRDLITMTRHALEAA